MIYLFALCLPSFLTSGLAIMFARRERGRQRRFWWTAALAGYVPLPILIFMMMFGLGLMREVEMSTIGALSLIAGVPFIACSIGIACAMMAGLIKPVRP